MSDTYKDRPYWVRANDPNEPLRYAIHRHAHRPRHFSADTRVVYSKGEPVTCTIDIPETPRHVWNSSTSKLEDYMCGHVLRLSHNWHNAPSRRDRRERYFGPQRRAEREYTAQAAQDYNSGAEEFLDDQIFEAGDSHIKDYWNW